MTTPATIHGLPLPNTQDPTNHIYFIGVDEVARGCLAGPVVSCAMCLDITKIQTTLATQTSIPKICDSKKLTPKNRTLAERWILDHSLSHAIGQSNITEIDTLNIREATFLAMNRALVDCIAGLNIPDISTATLNIIIDGNAFKIMPGFEAQLSRPNITITTLVKGDAHDITIACASIIAKEYHDMHIHELVKNNPDLDTKYSLLSNMGYPTAKHFDGIKKYGCSEYHRKTFKGVL